MINSGRVRLFNLIRRWRPRSTPTGINIIRSRNCGQNFLRKNVTSVEIIRCETLVAKYRARRRVVGTLLCSNDL
ncbi:hypothetical protein PUN28_011075 [Cardiocondyla obscurior]|uniref:Uncharacterized protein n=1 Tax=Cardiocondyla obscurior TaxID=286306 RepID=A0AAW2FLN8_9HYME